MIFSFKQYLVETQLSPAEVLDKVANSGHYEGQWRTSIIKQMIEDGKEFELQNGDTIKIDKETSIVKQMLSMLPDSEKVSGDKADELKAFFKKEKPFIDIKTGKAYKLSDIKKSEDFGGGSKGSGGGSADTEKNESLQCVVTAIAAHIGKEIDENDLTIENIDKVDEHFDISFTYSNSEELLNEIIRDKKWLNSYVETANILRKELKLSSSYNFFRQNSWVKSLYDLAKKLNKIDEGPFKDMNKWNPSDIWIVNGHKEIPTNFNSLVELNTWLSDQFGKSKNIVGVSLKKTGNTAEYDIQNAENIANEIGNIDLLDFSISDKNNKIFIAKNAYIYFEDETMQIKSKQQGYSAIQGEILGKSAKHGAIGLGPINSILKRVSLPKVKTIDEIKSLIDFNEKDKQKKYSKLLDLLVDNINTIETDVSKDEIKNQFIDSEKTNNEPWVVSKYQAVELISILQKASSKKRKEFVFHAFAFASSKSDLSSIYVKVS